MPQRLKNIHPDVIEIFNDFKETSKNRNIEFDVIGIGEISTADGVADIGEKVLSKPIRRRRKQNLN